MSTAPEDPNDIRSHDRRWNGLLQDAVDGTIARGDHQQLKLHLDECARCRTTFQQLSDLNVALRNTLGRVHAPPNFDARLLRRIAASDGERIERARLHEQREHRLRLERLAREWRGIWRFHLGNAIGLATMLLGILALTAGDATVVRSWMEAPFGLRIPTFLLIIGAASLVAIWLTKRADGDSSGTR